jgi:hypothetical protein
MARARGFPRVAPFCISKTKEKQMDIGRLVSDLKTTAALLVALKRVLRSSGHRMTQLEARTLAELKSQATRLCCLRAHLRGKLHLQRMTLDEQAAFIDDERQIYTRRPAA